MSELPMPATAAADAAAAGAKRNKKRTKKRTLLPTEALSAEGWKRLDMDDIQIEGFEDGSMFEVEELTEYTLQTDEAGGKMLVLGSSKGEKPAGDDVQEPASKKRKRKKGKQQREAEMKKEQAEQAAAGTPTDETVTPTIAMKKEVADVKVKMEDVEMDDVKVKVEDVGEKEEEEEEQAQPRKKKAKKANTKAAAANKKKAAAAPAPIPRVTLPKWDKFKLHPLLRHSLHASGFLSPTPIQEKTIYPALVDNRDVVGAAPTGSGKTLAFGLPILSQLLFEKDRKGYVKECKALILTPTRELALQIQQHFEKMVPNREIGVMTLVGGMSVQKQMRMMTYKPEIVIGTPGRLWDLIDSNHDHLKNLDETLRFLVIDEADRMLQAGSYAEVEKIFEVVKYNPNKHEAALLQNLSDDESEDGGDDDDDEMLDPSLVGETKVMMLADMERFHENQEDSDDDNDDDDEEEEVKKTQAAKTTAPSTRHIPRQTFLFSATLTIPEGGRFQTGKKKHRHALTVLENVMKRVGLRGKPAVVDMSIDESKTKGKDLTEEETMKLRKKQENVALSLPAGLELCEHEVTDDTRDTYLYYFLTQYPGKTIVFLNSIHQVRKLANLLSLLKLPVFALHAEMQQRQRLKKLDGFKANPQGILIATDVAARGLDIPSVDYVVHYHIARSTEVFVHRSGRTARANKEGLSISLVGPADAKNHTQICKMLQRPTGLAEFPFDHRFLPVIDERLRLATGINDHENVVGKVKSEETWFSQMAKEADLDFDDNLLQELESKKQKTDKTKQKNGESVESMRRELARLLAEPLRPVGSVRKFRQLYQEIGTSLAADGEYKKRNASEDLETKSKKSYKQFRRRQ